MSHSLSKKFTFGSLLLFALPTIVAKKNGRRTA